MCERDQSSISHQWESGTAPLQGRESQERTRRWKINLLWPGKFTIGRFQISFTSLNVCHLGELVVVIIIIRRWTLDNGQALKKWEIRGKMLKIGENQSSHRLGSILVEWAVGGREGGAEKYFQWAVLPFLWIIVSIFCFLVFSYFATRPVTSVWLMLPAK